MAQRRRNEKCIPVKDVVSMLIDGNESELDCLEDDDDTVEDKDWNPPAKHLGQESSSDEEEQGEEGTSHHPKQK